MNKYYSMGEESEVETDGTVAKSVDETSNGATLYYIKFHRGKMVNPQAGDFFRLRKNEVSWRKVNHDAFTKYVKFLQSGQERFLLYAQREIQE